MKLLDEDGLTDKGVRPKSRVQRWRLIRDGLFPRPIKIGSRNMWVESEVNAWIAERIRERDATEAA